MAMKPCAIHSSRPTIPPAHGTDVRAHAVGYSLRIRLVLVFMALAVTVAVVFMGGMQKVVALGWKEAARPLLMDYVGPPHR